MSLFSLTGRRKPVVTEAGIYGFFEKYKFLANDEFSPILLDGIQYPSAEHAYAAERTTDLSEKRVIASQTSPPVARKVGQYVTPRSDWETYQETALERVIRAKFSQNADLAKRLVATGSRYLEDTNSSDDIYWGGRNAIGKILMRVREELMSHPEPAPPVSSTVVAKPITSRPPRW